MHKAVDKFIREVKSEYPYKFRNKRVLEVGSHNINGSPRKHFWFCKYQGVDISKGKGVDIVGKLTDIEGTLGTFQTIISTEMIEHDRDWKQSLKIMYDKLEVGGLLIITCASLHRHEHGTKRTTPECSPDTTDYYGNIGLGEFEKVLHPSLFDPYVLQYARGYNDLQFYGIKKEVRKPTSKDIYQALLKNESN